MKSPAEYAVETAEKAREASGLLAGVTADRKNAWLRKAAGGLRERRMEIQASNSKDLEAASGYGLSSAAIDRLKLTDARIEAIAAALEQVANLPDPVGEIIEGFSRPNGLRVSKVRVPLGVVFFIYESRPNVTADAAALCVKSGNAVILRGGKEALHSNQAIHAILKDALVDAGLPAGAVQLVETTDRAVVGDFLALHELIDVVIPRGGKGLIERVAAEARMPVIKHFDGICHIYVDRSASFDMAHRIILNSKVQRPGVCNALETLLVNAEIAGEFLPEVAKKLRALGVELRGCGRTRELVADVRPASDEDWRTEYLDLILALRVVPNLDEAIRHINQFGSHHTDAIITNDLATATRFCTAVDSAAVMVNASTRFNDGSELGLGAEIGISTDKFHARGPCGLRELTSYKWIVIGEGQIRE